jgi:putative ABC transport system substrate-binding protein
MMRRRDFIAGLGAATWPLAARAQQGERVRRVGVFSPSPKSDPVAQSGIAAFVQALQTLGWSEGRNVSFEFGWADSGFAQIQGIAKELVALRLDVIYAFGGAPGVKALAQETRVIPIVFSGVSDPVAQGFVESLARPGGNATGFSLYEASVGTKWLEALNRLAPDVRRITLIFNPQMSSPALYLPSIEAAAVSLKVELHTNPVLDLAEIERAMAALSREPGGGLIFLPDLFVEAHQETIVGLAARYRLPAVYPLRSFDTFGGLMSYGIDADDLCRRAATYVDRILKGAKPAELPVQQPTKYELVLNVRTAEALGLTAPPGLLAITDELIE